MATLMRMSHPMMMRMMMLILRGMRRRRSTPAPVDSIVVALPAVNHAPSAEETEPFETDESAATPPPHPAYRVTARISIQDEPPTSFWSDTEVARLLAIPTPPPSPFSPCSSPLPQIPSPPLPVSPPPPASPTYPLGYRAAMIRLRAEALSTSHSPPPHIILSHARADTPSSGAPGTKDTELGRRMTEFSTRVRQDMNEIYVKLDDEQTERQLMADRLNMLYRDRRAHARTALLMEIEARMSRDAWGRSMDASDLARSEVMSLRTTVLGQQAKMAPKRDTRSNTAPETTNTTSVTNAQLQAMIDQGVTAALAARDADISTNGIQP
ncbi:hypothetical protein Tco_0328960 [Tanacetum coccineum]